MLKQLFVFKTFNTDKNQQLHFDELHSPAKELELLEAFLQLFRQVRVLLLFWHLCAH
jgi:hypothetical protein